LSGVSFIPEQSHFGDLAYWRRLARDVEPLFGQPMAGDPTWEKHLAANIRRGAAWCVRDASRSFCGGMWLSWHDAACLHIRWLAVSRDVRRRGAGRALVLCAIDRAKGRPVHVVTFGADHPFGAEAEAARRLYFSLGFQAYEHDRAADGTPRALFVLRTSDELPSARPIDVDDSA
jgi:GNAT superfamily N-acetyltransferase